MAGDHVPDSNGLRVLDTVLLGRDVAVSDHELLVRREGNKLNVGMAEALELLPPLAAPKDGARRMQRREVHAVRRPLNVGVRPFLTHRSESSADSGKSKEKRREKSLNT